MILRAGLVAALLAALLFPLMHGGSDAAATVARDCPARGDGEIWVAGGRTRIGSDRGYAEEGPAHDVTVKGFWIDRHEVTNRQFAAFVTATGHVTTAERAGGSIVFDPPAADEIPVDPKLWWKYVPGAQWRHPEGSASSLAGRAELPVVHVSYEDARAYARWAGRSLPSEEQFEFAARAGAAESLEQPAPDSANIWQGRFPLRNEQLDGYARLAPAGCYKPNGFGLSDMIGNAWEWTQSGYLPTHAAIAVGGATPGNPSFDPAQPGVRVRVIKGGSFLCAPNYCARYRPEARHAQDERSGASHLGFRTVRNGPLSHAQSASTPITAGETRSTIAPMP